MKIRVIGHSGEMVFPFGQSGPWKAFSNALELNENTIATGDFSESADAIIVNHHNEMISNYMEFHKIPINKRALVIWEPYIIETTRYNSSVLNQYGNIYAPSIHWARATGAKAFNWPQDIINSYECNQNWKLRLNRAVIIQGNKFSARKGEMYSLRRKVLRADRNFKIDLFGTNWNKGLKFDWWHWSRSLLGTKITDFSLQSIFGLGFKYPQYQGPIDIKNNVLQKYKLSVVIENSLDFVSEKLFDVVRNGCVAIYVGPNIEEYGIESGVIKQVEPNKITILEELENLLKLSNEELLKISNAQLKQFIQISKFWENSSVLEKLAINIVNDFNSN